MPRSVFATAMLAVLLPAVTAKGMSNEPGEQAAAVGVLLEAEGPVFLKSAGKPAEERVDSSSVGKLLYQGDQIRCSGRCSARLRVLRETVTLTAVHGLYTIPGFVNPSEGERKLLDALRSYGTPGGSRGGSSGFFSPSEGGSVRPERLVLQWVPRPGTLSMRILGENGGAVWQQEGIDASTGMLDSEAARKALVDCRARGEIGNLALLVAESGTGRRTRVTFDLLTPQDETGMDEALAEWNNESNALIRAIGRAHVFQQWKLFAEVAGEYEAALELAPESHELLRRAAEAAAASGNSARSTALRRQFEKSPTGR